MQSEWRLSGLVVVFSAMSAWSLVLFGGLSVLVVCFSWSFVGLLIGAALLGHGYFEHRSLKQLRASGERSGVKKLAWNQMALAGSVSLYLGWQVASIDRAELDAMLARDPLHTLLLQAPPEAAEMLRRDLAALLAGAYAIAGFLVILSCLGMAFMYLRSGRK